MLVPSHVPIFIATSPADFRKQINGLAGLVQNELGYNPTSDALYVFFNQRRDQVKILYFQAGGFCIWRKRLEQGTFAAVPHEGARSITLTTTELLMLIDGISLTQRPRRKRYKKAA